MSSINFRGCRKMEDVVRLHAEVLPGKVLIECTENRQPFSITAHRTPLFGVDIEGTRAVFETEDQDYKKICLAFPLGLTVVTSINDEGDIWWPKAEDDWSKFYGIDDLNDNDINVDSVLRFAAELPVTNIFLQ